MCGLGGLARLDGGDLAPSADRILADMARALAHRGPDDVELLRDGPFGLAFTRLSLVDPEGGGQPLYSEDGTIVLIANGEIYNHRELEKTLAAGTRLRTRSDCEVLVHLYRQRGLAFLDEVRGMFALVLVDRRERRLILARDHFGVKPMYYHRGPDHITFGSEIKALFENPACPRRLDWQQALAHPALTAAPVINDAAPTAWFEGVEQVPAATIVDIDLRVGTTRTHRYWSLPEPGTCEDSDEQIIGTFGRILTESITDCAMADAEIGLFLSGGIDSAAVAAVAARTSGLHTFTVLSGSTVLNGDARYGALAAAALGLPNHQVVFAPQRVPDPPEWMRLLWLTEMPQCGPEQFYKYELHRYVKAHHPEIKGMLLGAAADEFTGGYSTSTAPGGDWDVFTDTLAGLARNRVLQQHPGLAMWFDSPAPLLTDRVLGDAPMLDDPYAAFVDWKFRDIAQYNCWHEDRTAAGNGVEARVPFLDVRLVELVHSIPRSRRAALLWDKHILRAAMRQVVPDVIATRPKVPFYHGEGYLQTHATFLAMLEQDGYGLLERALATSTAREYINADNVVAQLRALREDPAAGHVEQILRVINLGLIDAMAQRPPARPVDAERAPVPVALAGTDWTARPEQITATVLRRVPITGQEVLALRPDALLLCSPAAPGTWFVAVAGELTYELDDADPWTAVLRHLDGERSLEHILTELGTPLEAIEGPLRDAIDLGVVHPVDQHAPAPLVAA